MSQGCYRQFSCLALLGYAAFFFFQEYFKAQQDESSKKEKDLFPAGQQLSDLPSFRFTINSDLCGQAAVPIVTIISSGVTNLAARSAIRGSWGRPALPGAALAFLLGTPSHSPEGREQQRQLEQESLQHGDLVQGNFLDTYRNLTYKNLMGKLWVASFCSQAEMVVKSDDDAYVDLYEARTLGEAHMDTREYREGLWILGPVKRGDPVLRVDSKWKVTAEELDEKIKFYPEYCNSIFYMFNVPTAIKLLDAAKNTKYLFIDDAYVTGILRVKINATLVDTKSFQTLNSAELMASKSGQSPDVFKNDFINGLLARDAGQAEFSKTLESHARRCYEHSSRCLNNVYYPHFRPCYPGNCDEHS